MDRLKEKVNGKYLAMAYDLARQNTKYNKNGEAVISREDEWIEEGEWDALFASLSKRLG